MKKISQNLRYNTSIVTDSQQKIKGKIARVGGVVNQVISYKDCIVEDINIPDGGFGSISKFNMIRNPKDFLLFFKRRVHQELFFKRYGPKIPRDTHTVLAEMHQAYTHQDLIHKYDALISSNVIEHSYNPILLLLNFALVTKQKGYQFHALPHYQYTYDMYRKPTSFQHFLDDFAQFKTHKDTSHNKDYVQSAVVKHGWQKEFHQKYPVTYPYIHYHVFDESNTQKLFELIFEEVTVDFLMGEDKNVIVLCSNTLKKSFIKKYQKQIAIYFDKVSTYLIN